MQQIVNQSSRHAKMRAHTATHLLHAQLCKIYPETRQAGSLVDEDYLRFDYLADQMLSEEQIQSICSDINHQIYIGAVVNISEMSIDQAAQLGAKMFFGDKYGDIVRVVQIADHISTELCGGTHVTDISHIGSFVIIGQQAVASGTKRIIATTGPKVWDYISSQNQIIHNTSYKLDCDHKQISDKLDKILKDNNNQKKQIDNIYQASWSDIQYNQKDIGFHQVYIYDISTSPVLHHLSIGQCLGYTKGSQGNYIIYHSNNGGYMIYSSLGLASDIQQTLGLKGGGNQTIIQGKDDSIKGIL